MRLPPLATGIGAGLVAALLLAPVTGSALGRLAKARAERVELTASAARSGQAPLVAPSAAVGDPVALAAHIRERARSSGVLVEEAAARADPALAVVRLRLSGPEKSVVAVVDALERDARLVRLRGWRIEALPGGGVRLTGDAVGARQ